MNNLWFFERHTLPSNIEKTTGFSWRFSWVIALLTLLPSVFILSASPFSEMPPEIINIFILFILITLILLRMIVLDLRYFVLPDVYNIILFFLGVYYVYLRNHTSVYATDYLHTWQDAFGGMASGFL